MGTPLPRNVSATPCPICWGLGKKFGLGPTPRVIEVRLTSILQGEFGSAGAEQLLLTTHWLVTTTIVCTWTITDATFFWILTFSLQFTTLEVRNLTDNRQAFVDDFPPACTVDFPNALQDPAGNVAFGGFANLTWNPEDL